MSSSLFISKLRVSLKIGHLSPSLHICVDFFYFPICTVTYGSFSYNYNSFFLIYYFFFLLDLFKKEEEESKKK